MQECVRMCQWMCVYSFSQPTNYCPEEPTAVATIAFFLPRCSPSFSCFIPPLSWQGGVRGEPQPQVLLPWGVITPLWDSAVTHTCTRQCTVCLFCLFLSITMPLLYVLQLSLWLLLWGQDTRSCEHSLLILMFPLYLSLLSCSVRWALYVIEPCWEKALTPYPCCFGQINQKLELSVHTGTSFCGAGHSVRVATEVRPTAALRHLPLTTLFLYLGL